MGLFYGKKNLKHCSVTTGKPAPLFLLILKTQWESFICVCVCVCVGGGGVPACSLILRALRSLEIQNVCCGGWSSEKNTDYG